MQSTDAPVHTRTESLGPVRLSYPDLLATIQRVRSLIESANGPSENRDYVSEWLRLKDDVIEVELKSSFALENLHGAPEVASEVWYRYTRNNAPVAEVNLWLRDFSREVKVTGSSRAQVDAIAGLVVADSRKNRAFFGGAMPRLAAGLVLMLIGLLLPLGASLPLPLAAQWSFLIFGPIVSVSVWALPWKSRFPGTAVYAGDVSWLARNAPMISFAGILLTLLTFVLSVVFSVYLSGRQPSSTAPVAPESGQSSDRR